MVRRIRRGSSRAGCLLMMLAFTATGYFALNVGQVFWSYYQFEDRLKQEARFAAHRSDGVIRRRIIQYADSLGLPEGAKLIRVRRKGNIITISADYYEHVELPGYVREFHFNPQATTTF